MVEADDVAAFFTCLALDSHQVDGGDAVAGSGRILASVGAYNRGSCGVAVSLKKAEENTAALVGI